MLREGETSLVERVSEYDFDGEGALSLCSASSGDAASSPSAMPKYCFIGATVSY